MNLNDFSAVFGRILPVILVSTGGKILIDRKIESLFSFDQRLFLETRARHTKAYVIWNSTLPSLGVLARIYKMCQL